MTTGHDEPRADRASRHRVGDHTALRRFDELLDTIEQAVDLDRLATLAVSAAGGLGAYGGVVMVLDGAAEVEAVGIAGTSRSIMASLGPLLLSRRLPLMTAMHTGVPVWLPSPAASRAGYPEFASFVDVGKATASLPLRVGGMVVGGLGLTFAEAQVFSDTDRALLLAIAAACARGVRAFRADSAHTSAATPLVDVMGDAVAEVDD